MSKNLSDLSGRKGLTENLFEELGIAAKTTGTPSIEEMDRLSQAFLVGKANVYGSVSFYDFLRPENQGKKVYVCNGSACMTAGTQDAVQAKLANHFSANEIGAMTCLGRCHENSAFNCGGKNYSGTAIDRIADIKANKPTIPDDYKVGSRGAAVLTRLILK